MVQHLPSGPAVDRYYRRALHCAFSRLEVGTDSDVHHAVRWQCRTSYECEESGVVCGYCSVSGHEIQHEAKNTD